MSSPSEQQSAPSSRRWVRLCRWLWAQRGFIWGTLIVGILVSIMATWLITQTSIFIGTPLGTGLLWIRDLFFLLASWECRAFWFTRKASKVSHFLLEEEKSKTLLMKARNGRDVPEHRPSQRLCSHSSCCLWYALRVGYFMVSDY